jgi:hypothetical protein
MALRICLILAILAGIGVIVVSQVQLRTQIQTIIQDRNTNKENWDKEKNRANKLNKELGDTKTKLTATEKSLTQTQTELTSTKSSLDDEKKRAKGLQDNLDKTKASLLASDQELSAWKALGIPVEGVKGVIDSEKTLRSESQVLMAENKIMAKKLTDAMQELDGYKRGNPDADLPLAATIRGKVVAVDPKWSFVVLDVGAEQGVKEKGVLLVSRNSKLIAKVKVTSVQGNRSVANIVPGWKIGELLEGDLVVPSDPLAPPEAVRSLEQTLSQSGK